MAAGKSTVATILGAKLGWRIEDVDSLIETREQKTVADIFLTHGETYFRSAERTELHDLLRQRNMVVATGGGTFVDPDNIETINNDGMSIWLDVSLETVRSRLQPDGQRPLANEETSMEALYNTRRRSYQHAHLRLDANSTTSSELVEHILEWLRNLCSI